MQLSFIVFLTFVLLLMYRHLAAVDYPNYPHVHVGLYPPSWARPISK